MLKRCSKSVTDFEICRHFFCYGRDGTDLAPFSHMISHGDENVLFQLLTIT